MEIAQKWKMLPTEVYQLKVKDPINYTFMRAKILADYEIGIGLTDFEEPVEIEDFAQLFYLL